MSAGAAGAAAPAATIGPIASVTIATADVGACVAAYVRHLGYRPGLSGHVSDSQAAAWGRPAAGGARFAEVHPAAGNDFCFRFVEVAGLHGGYRAFSSHGWNAAELIVADVDAMAAELSGSAFEVLGPPQDLSFTDAIRAMQVRGPAGEVLYLTQFKRPLESLPAPMARCKVDRAFIVIVGGADLDALVDFYVAHFAVPPPQRMESRVKAMSEIFGLSPEHRYRIAAVPLRARCYIEADQMPDAAAPPGGDPRHLPPGIAAVGFVYHGGRARPAVTGPAGEIFELVAP